MADPEKVTSASTPLPELVTEAEEFLISHNNPDPDYAPTYYLLDHFGSDLTSSFLENWPTSTTEEILLLENVTSLVFLTKLMKNAENNYPSSEQKLSAYFAEIKSKQENSGKILNEHPVHLWALVNYEPNSDATKRAIDYFMEEISDPHKVFKYSPGGILALMELDYNKYADFIDNVVNIYKNSTVPSAPNSFITAEYGRIYDDSLLALLLSRHKKTDSDCNLILQLKDRLQKRAKRHIDDLPYDPPLEKGNIGVMMNKVGCTGLGLTATGHDYMVSASESNWKRDLLKQQKDLSKPQLVTTLPTTRLETRKEEIRNRMEKMILSSTENLRIATIRIDMLHDEIIDAKENHNSLEVKYLTTPKSGKGNRSKMKTAVENEMIVRLRGNVHEDRLMHTRMIISDRSELLVSSADLTRDQLVDEFNVGIYTRDKDSISEAITIFDKMWNEAESADQR